MKLELKHLSLYSPHGLKVMYKGKKIKVDGIYNSVNGNDCIAIGSKVDGILYEDFKLILRPLSDLTKMIEVDGEISFIPITYFCEQSKLIINTEWNNEDTLYIAIHGIPYYDIVKLFQWHFDVFGLIEKGLAININEL